MKYTLCIKLNIDGKEIEQELATFSLESLEKYASYCESFSALSYNSFRKDFIYYLGATQQKIANFLDKHKASDQPLFIKCGEKYTDIPVLYKKDIDVLLITEDELNKLLDYFNSHRAHSFEDKIKLGVGLKEWLQENNLFNLIKEVKITEKGKAKRLEDLNERLNENNENYKSVVEQIGANVKPLLDLVNAEKRKNDKAESEVTQPNYVVTGMRHEEDADEDKKYTIYDELKNYEMLRDRAKTPEEQRALSMLVDTTKKVIEYRNLLQEKIKLRKDIKKSSDISSLQEEIERLQLNLSEYEKRMDDLANGNVYFGDGELEIDDLNYGGIN